MSDTPGIIDNWSTLGITGRVDVESLTVGGVPITGAGGGGSPAGPFGAIQFNNAGAFAGSESFVVASGGDIHQMKLGTISNVTSGEIWLGGSTDTNKHVLFTGSPLGTLVVRSGFGTAASPPGESINLIAGDGFTGGAGGDVNMNGGNAGGGGGQGGNVFIYGGQGNGGQAGNISFVGGVGSDVPTSGSVLFQMWASTWAIGPGGDLSIDSNPGTAGQQLTSSGPGVAPTWGTALLRNGTDVPATATSVGTQGTVTWDADYVYVCVATNTWKRTALATW